MGPTYHLSFCACKTARLAAEPLVSMGPVVFTWKTATLGAELQLSMCPRPHLSFSPCKTEWIASELLVSMGPSPHLWFLDAKEGLLDQNYKSLWVVDLTRRFLDAKQGILDQNYKSLWIVDLTWRFVHAKQRLWIRITSLYEFKLSSVFLCIENRVPSIRITSPYGSQA